MHPQFWFWTKILFFTLVLAYLPYGCEDQCGKEGEECLDDEDCCDDLECQVQSGDLNRCEHVTKGSADCSVVGVGR